MQIPTFQSFRFQSGLFCLNSKIHMQITIFWMASLGRRIGIRTPISQEIAKCKVNFQFSLLEYKGKWKWCWNGRLLCILALGLYSKMALLFSTQATAQNLCYLSPRITLLANGTLKIVNATRRDAGSYTCIAKNQFGTASATGRLLITGVIS